MPVKLFNFFSGNEKFRPPPWMKLFHPYHYHSPEGEVAVGMELFHP
jgi:hypothetical protein